MGAIQLPCPLSHPDHVRRAVVPQPSGAVLPRQSLYVEVASKSALLLLLDSQSTHPSETCRTVLKNQHPKLSQINQPSRRLEHQIHAAVALAFRDNSQTRPDKQGFFTLSCPPR